MSIKALVYFFLFFYYINTNNKYSYFKMCDWKTEWFNIQNQIHGNIKYNDNGSINVEGKLEFPFNSQTNKLIFVAAKEADLRTSYSGAGLPFANSEMAYDSTPNQGEIDVELNTNKFSFSINAPNSYYSGLGTVYIKPHIQLILIENQNVVNIFTVKVNDGIPFRTLSYPDAPPRCSPLFYGNNDILPVRTQEQILRDSSYPDSNDTPSNFWGLRPAN